MPCHHLYAKCHFCPLVDPCCSWPTACLLVLTCAPIRQCHQLLPCPWRPCRLMPRPQRHRVLSLHTAARVRRRRRRGGHAPAHPHPGCRRCERRLRHGLLSTALQATTAPTLQPAGLLTMVVPVANASVYRRCLRLLLRPSGGHGRGQRQ